MIDGLVLSSLVLRWLGVEATPTIEHTDQVRVVDRRNVAKRKLDAASSRRSPSQVRAVVAHQFDCEFGLTARQIKRAGGDQVEALIQRAMDTPYHVVALRCGVVVLNHHADLHTYHAGHGNGGLGLGIEGSFPTLAAERTEKYTPIAAVEAVARLALREAVSMIEGPGKRIELQAHRQWSGSRGRDPGEEIWRALRPVADQLGMSIDPELAFRPQKGRPIPVEWDERARYDIKGRPVRG